MENLDVMEGLQTPNNLYEYPPDLIFVDVLLLFLMGCDLLK